ncbi:MAG TPA: hypothetical protein VHO25_05125 [Polyangiaceae bacterium]|nr:hypothetical protein [Polyangiaceae bacterium]
MSSLNTERWYYCDTERDNETAYGPVSLGRLCELIRSEQLPYGVLVSNDPMKGPHWAEADTIEEIVRAIPLDRERLIVEYLGYGEAPLGEEPWGWASDRMYSLLEGVPELAWDLIIEMIERAPSDDSLSFIAASPLEDLLSKDGPLFITRVEDRARENTKFRRALGMLNRLGMTDDVWQRVQTAASV